MKTYPTSNIDEITRIHLNTLRKPGTKSAKLQFDSPRETNYIHLTNLSCVFTAFGMTEHHLDWKYCVNVVQSIELASKELYKLIFSYPIPFVGYFKL